MPVSEPPPSTVTSLGRTRHPAPGGLLVTLHWGEIQGRAEIVGIDIHTYDDCESGVYSQSVGIGGPIRPLKARDLRGVPLGRLEQESRQSGTISALDADLRRLIGEAPLPSELDPWQREKRRTPGRPRVYDDEWFRSVAEIYLTAHRAGRPPTKAVAESHDVSKSTASKWVARARRLGFLAPTSRGKPSGVSRRDR